MCLYAGSLVPREIVAAAPAGARVLDTAPLTLDEIVAEIAAAHAPAHDVARVHSGDPSLYGAIAEQMRRLDALGIAYDVTPGVPAFAAAAAALRRELTLPGMARRSILTRTADARLGDAARARASTASPQPARRWPSISRSPISRVSCASWRRFYGADCPAVVVYRVELAGRAADPRHARRHPRAGEGGGDHPHGADPGRAGRWPATGAAKAGSTPPTITTSCGRGRRPARPARPAPSRSAPPGRLRPGHHHHRQAQLARGGELGVGQLAAARLDERARRPRAAAAARPRPRPGTAAGPTTQVTFGRQRSAGPGDAARSRSVKAGCLAQSRQGTAAERGEDAAGGRAGSRAGLREAVDGVQRRRAATARWRAARGTGARRPRRAASAACSVMRAAKGWVASTRRRSRWPRR